MAESNRINMGPAPEIKVTITPVIDRDLRRRNVFPQLRSENAEFMRGPTYIHIATIEDAEAILKDANGQYESMGRSGETRGLRHAYRSLIDGLTAKIRQAKGLWDDPGIEAARKRLIDSPARFNVGDRVRWCSPWVDDDDDGKELIVTGEYALHIVAADDDGPFVMPDGRRITYKVGYLCRGRQDNESRFFPAGELQTRDYKTGHLRLVETRRRA